MALIGGLIGAVVDVPMNLMASSGPRGFSDWLVLAALSAAIVGLIAVGTLVVARQPDNRIGWLFVAVGYALLLWSLSSAYAQSALTVRPESLPLGVFVGWVSNWTLPLVIALFIPIFLLFPDGHLPSRRWHPVMWAWAIGTALSTGLFSLNHTTIGFGSGSCPPKPGDMIACVANPITDPSVRNLLGTIGNAAGIATFLTAIAAIAAIVVRHRRAEGEVRQQIRWLVFVGVGFFVAFAANLATLAIVGENNVPEWLGTIMFTAMASVLVIGLPAALTIAILRYHLYDLEFVIRKTVVFGLLAVFITGVYVAIVGGIGAIVGSRGSTTLSFVAAAALAVLFQPARDRARRVADQLVYGKRATPYEVLAEFSGRMSETYATEDVLPRMAEILRAGTGASMARVWLRVGGELRLEAAAGDPTPTSAIALHGDAMPEVAGEHAVEVRHQGELLGALSVGMPANDPMNPAKDQLVRDLAAQAGSVLRNVRLIEELRSSRQRLVAAQDEERRKIERNLHDGAQQQLVAMSVKLRLAEGLAERDPEKAKAAIADLQTDAREALENLRDLARGIYPPLLADRGLAEALAAQARKSIVPTIVKTDGIGRYAREVEATVYFCSLEALNNIAKYAGASQATIELRSSNEDLVVEISDDGTGFDPASIGFGTGLQGMADRLDAIGGTLSLRSSPGAGTTVIGTVPV